MSKNRLKTTYYNRHCPSVSTNPNFPKNVQTYFVRFGFSRTNVSLSARSLVVTFNVPLTNYYGQNSNRLKTTYYKSITTTARVSPPILIFLKLCKHILFVLLSLSYVFSLIITLISINLSALPKNPSGKPKPKKVSPSIQGK